MARKLTGFLAFPSPDEDVIFNAPLTSDNAAGWGVSWVTKQGGFVGTFTSAGFDVGTGTPLLYSVSGQFASTYDKAYTHGYSRFDIELYDCIYNV